MKPLDLTQDGVVDAINTHPRWGGLRETQERLAAALVEAKEREIAAAQRVAEVETNWKTDLSAGRVTPLAKTAQPARDALAQATEEVRAIEEALAQSEGDRRAAYDDALADLFDQAMVLLKPEAKVVAALLQKLEDSARPLIAKLEATRSLQRGRGPNNKLGDNAGSPLQNIIGRIPPLLQNWRDSGLVE